MAIIRSILIIVLTSFFWTAMQTEASAQRTAEGSMFIGASQMVSSYAVPSGWLDLGAGGYLRSLKNGKAEMTILCSACSVMSLTLPTV